MKISICVPVYNDVEGTKRLFASIASQEYTDYEVIVSDDSNQSVTDKIKQLVEAFGEQFKYFRHLNSLGPADNWNNCLNLASGEFIKIMHQDDFFVDEYSLRRFVDLLEKVPDCSIAFSGSKEVYQDYSYNRSISLKDEKRLNKNFRYLFFKNCIGAPSTTIFKSTNFRFDERLRWFVDVDFYMALLQENPNYSFTHDSLVCIGHGAGQVTNSCIYNTQILEYEGKILYEKFHLKSNVKYILFYNFYICNHLLHLIRKLYHKIRR